VLGDADDGVGPELDLLKDLVSVSYLLWLEELGVCPVLEIMQNGNNPDRRFSIGRCSEGAEKQRDAMLAKQRMTMQSGDHRAQCAGQPSSESHCTMT
jgi:hypothetical protein